MGMVVGGIRTVLRLEGFVITLVAVMIFHELDYEWKLFFILFLVPDLSFFGYLVNPVVGGVAYNFFHNYAVAVLACAIGFLAALDWLLASGIIWVAHVGFDRALGYGLKYTSGFTHTHLVGRLINRVINFSQLQPSVQGGKAQVYRSYVEFFQRSNGGCSEDKVLPYLSSGPLSMIGKDKR